MTALWLQVPEASVRSFFHDKEGNINAKKKKKKKKVIFYQLLKTITGYIMTKCLILI